MCLLTAAIYWYWEELPLVLWTGFYSLDLGQFKRHLKSLKDFSGSQFEGVCFGMFLCIALSSARLGSIFLWDPSISRKCKEYKRIEHPFFKL